MRLSAEKNVQFYVNFNWFSSEIDRDYNIGSDRFFVLDVRLRISLILESIVENSCWQLQLHCEDEWKKDLIESIDGIRFVAEEKRVNEKLTNKQKVNENT